MSITPPDMAEETAALVLDLLASEFGLTFGEDDFKRIQAREAIADLLRDRICANGGAK